MGRKGNAKLEASAERWHPLSRANRSPRKRARYALLGRRTRLVRLIPLPLSFIEMTVRASPRLKDAPPLSFDAYTSLYTSLLLTVRKMYQECKLVHADLSEYNILYHVEKLWIIDVSQSVEHDHPSAFEFLRLDLKNISAWFEQRGVVVLGLRRAFEFVTGDLGDIGARPVTTDESSTPASSSGNDISNAESQTWEEHLLKQWIDEEQSADATGTTTSTTLGASTEDETTILEEETRRLNATEDQVFLHTYIPRSLSEMRDPEKVLDGRVAAPLSLQTKAISQAQSSDVSDFSGHISIVDVFDYSGKAPWHSKPDARGGGCAVRFRRERDRSCNDK